MAESKQQFNVYLTPSLVRQVKHQAIDEQLSLSDWVERVLLNHLAADAGESAALSPIGEAQSTGASNGLSLQPMVHVSDLTRAIAFYQALGFTVGERSRDGDWAQLRIGESELGLLAHPPAEGDERVELNLNSLSPLPDWEERLREAGITILRGAADEGFGYQLKIADPDGYTIKINQFDPDLYT